jgi:hypothetical protein
MAETRPPMTLKPPSDRSQGSDLIVTNSWRYRPPQGVNAARLLLEPLSP